MNARGMMAMGCAATTIGAFDLYRGSDYVKGVIEEHAIPAVSANVFDESTGEPFVQPYTVVERGGVKFGITGVIDPEADIRTHKDVEWLGVTMTDPKEALEGILPEMAEKSDFTIVLSQLTLDHSKLLAEEIQGIDFMLAGSVPQFSAAPFEVGGTVFIQPGYKGQRLADYRVQFDAEHVYTGYAGEAFDLGDKIPSDAAMALLLKEHKVAIEDAGKRRATANKQTRAPRVPAYKEECLGVAATCERCHQEQSEHWAATRHAHAFETLERGHQSTNPECLRCHTTCYIDMPLDGSVTVREDLKNVQCESCHGKATDHARDGSYGKISVATCTACHDKENSPDFDFAEYLAKVTH